MMDHHSKRRAMFMPEIDPPDVRPIPDGAVPTPVRQSLRPADPLRHQRAQVAWEPGLSWPRASPRTVAVKSAGQASQPSSQPASQPAKAIFNKNTNFPAAGARSARNHRTCGSRGRAAVSPAHGAGPVHPLIRTCIAGQDPGDTDLCLPGRVATVFILGGPAAAPDRPWSGEWSPDRILKIR